MFTDSEENKPKVDPVTVELINFIRHHYEPVEELSEANFIPSTAQVYQIIYKHYPSEALNQTDVFNLLKSAGYRYEFFPGTQNFVWLMKMV